jgi:hypothetical protein
MSKYGEPWQTTDTPNDACCWRSHVETVARGRAPYPEAAIAAVAEESTSRRIVACVNALSGRDPEKLSELVQAAAIVVANVPCIPRHRMKGMADVYGVPLNDVVALSAALAAFRREETE